MTTRSRARIQDDHISMITDSQSMILSSSLASHSFDDSEVDDDITATSRDLMTAVNDDANFMDEILVNCSQLPNSPAAQNTKKKTLTGTKKTKTGQCP